MGNIASIFSIFGNFLTHKGEVVAFGQMTTQQIVSEVESSTIKEKLYEKKGTLW